MADEADGDVAVKEDLGGNVMLDLRGGWVDMSQGHLVDRPTQLICQ